MSDAVPGHLACARMHSRLGHGARCGWPCRGALRRRPTTALRRQLEGAVDAGITPGDDFFAYANGGWLKATEIPAGKERWGARNEIEERTRRTIAELLDDASAAPAGSAARKVADFRAAYLNEAAIEARGLASLEAAARSHRSRPDKAELTRAAGQRAARRRRPDGLGRLQLSPILWAVGGAGQPRREDQRRLPAARRAGPAGPRALPGRRRRDMQALRARYRDYIGRMLALAGFDRAACTARPQAVMALETAIAQSHATREASADDRNADNAVDARRLRCARRRAWTGPRSSRRPGWPGSRPSSSGSRPP